MHVARIRPHVVVLVALLALAASLALSPAPAAAAGCHAADAAPSQLSKREASKAILCLLNNERSSHGLGSVKPHGDQAKAARKHSKLMIRRQCFSHQCPGEVDLTSRLASSDYLPCDCYWGVGENLAYGEGSSGSPRTVVNAWMKSAGHRVNILNGRYEHIGIGIVWGTPGSGSDRGAATYTTTFGYRD